MVLYNTSQGRYDRYCSKRARPILALEWNGSLVGLGFTDEGVRLPQIHIYTHPEDVALLRVHLDCMQQEPTELEEGQGYWLAFLWQPSVVAAPATIAPMTDRERQWASCIIQWFEELARIVAWRLSVNARACACGVAYVAWRLFVLCCCAFLFTKKKVEVLVVYHELSIGHIFPPFVVVGGLPQRLFLRLCVFVLCFVLGFVCVVVRVCRWLVH